MTHEGLSTFTPSEAISDEVEEAGELFCPQSNMSGCLGQSYFHSLCCHVRIDCFSSFSIGRVQFWVESGQNRLVQLRYSCTQSFFSLRWPSGLSFPEPNSVQPVRCKPFTMDLESHCCEKVLLGCGWRKPCVHASTNGITANAFWSRVPGSVYLTKPRGILCHSIFHLYSMFWNKVRK